ncbi:Cation/H+ exchanger, partial [Gorgonomyces haynaldii]
TQSEEHVHEEASVFQCLISLVIVVFVGALGGRMAEKVQQASMLGMVFTGVLLRNVLPSIIVPIPHQWTSKLWSLALTAVIARAGLFLEMETLWRNMIPSLAMGTIPVIVEASVMAQSVHWLFGLSYPWSFTVGFGAACMSPGVVVPLVLNAMESTWKTSRIPSIALAALSIDVLVATGAFGISLSTAIGHTHESTNSFHDSIYGRSFEEVGIGLSTGLFLGLFSLVLIRIKIAEPIVSGVFYILSSLIMIYTKTHGLSGAGISSCFVAWAFAANTWPKKSVEHNDTKLKTLWILFKPFLFPVIGSMVCLNDLPLLYFAEILLLVLITTVVKMLAAFGVGYSLGFNADERIFVSGLWTGKASVQATLCSVALEMVHHRGLGQAEERHALVVFMAMVSAILIGVPFATIWVRSLEHTVKPTTAPKIG